MIIFILPALEWTVSNWESRVVELFPQARMPYVTLGIIVLKYISRSALHSFKSTNLTQKIIFNTRNMIRP